MQASTTHNDDKPTARLIPAERALISPSCPITLQGKRYQSSSCYDGKIGFEQRRYPDEHLILQEVYAYCKESKLSDDTVLLAGKPLSDSTLSTQFKDKIVLDGETMYWEATGALWKPLDIIDRFNYFSKLGDNQPRLYILVFHWGYHHGFFAADFKHNAFLYLDPQGIPLNMRTSEYKNMHDLVCKLKDQKAHVTEYQGETLQTMDGNSCGPMTAECCEQLIKRMTDFDFKSSLAPEKMLLDARFNIPKLMTTKLKWLVRSNTMYDDKENNLINEISLIDRNMWEEVFKENKLDDRQKLHILKTLNSGKYFDDIDQEDTEKMKSLANLQANMLGAVAAMSSANELIVSRNHSTFFAASDLAQLRTTIDIMKNKYDEMKGSDTTHHNELDTLKIAAKQATEHKDNETTDKKFIACIRLLINHYEENLKRKLKIDRDIAPTREQYTKYAHSLNDLVGHYGFMHHSSRMPALILKEVNKYYPLIIIDEKYKDLAESLNQVEDVWRSEYEFIKQSIKLSR